MKDKLNYTEYGSACCWARVIDPGWTGEWICGDCWEHTSMHYIQEVDIAVLNYMDADKVAIHRIEYDSESSEYEDIEEAVTLFLVNEYGSTSNLEFMYDECSPIKIIDHRKEVEKTID